MNKKEISACGLIVLFIIITILVKTNNMAWFDNSVYNMLNIHRSEVLNSIFKVFTFFGSTKFIVALTAFFFFLFIILKKNNIGYLITACLVISTLFNNGVKLIIRRPRPEALKLLNLVVEKSTSFPSGHTMASVSMYVLLIYLIWKKSNLSKGLKIALSIVLGILPICVGISRIYLGAHYASDVLGGAILSLALLLIEISVVEKKKWLK